MARCEVCNGAGAVTVRATCATCQGTGELVDYDDDGNEQLDLCSNCEFGLIFVEQLCSTCGGRGEVWPFAHDPLT